MTVCLRLSINQIFLQFDTVRVECVCDKKRWLASISNICYSILRILMLVSGTYSIRGRKNYQFSVIHCISIMYNCILQVNVFVDTQFLLVKSNKEQTFTFYLVIHVDHIL